MKALGVSNITIWIILLKKELTSSSTTSTFPEDHERQLKTPEVCACHCRCLQRCTYTDTSQKGTKHVLESWFCSSGRSFSVQDPPESQSHLTVGFHNLRKSLKPPKKSDQFCNKIRWTDEIKINVFQNDGKKTLWGKKGSTKAWFELVFWEKHFCQNPWVTAESLHFTHNLFVFLSKFSVTHFNVHISVFIT